MAGVGGGLLWCVLSHEFSSALASGGVSSGTSFLMNPVLPAYFITAYAVALFCFMLVLFCTRDLSWPCLRPAAQSERETSTRLRRRTNNKYIIILTLCSVYTGLCASLYVCHYAVFMLFDYATSCKNNRKLNAVAYASFMRVLPMRRMFQVLLYAGFMHVF